MKEFKKANISSMLAIEKAQRDELLQSTKEEGSAVRNRKKKVDSDGLLHMSTGMFYPPEFKLLQILWVPVFFQDKK